MDNDREFKRMVCYLWLQKGDPTRFDAWDAERCQRLMPAFYEAWSKIEIYTELANLAAKKTVVDGDDGF